MRATGIITGLFFCAAALTFSFRACAFGAKPANPTAQKRALWSEFLSYEDVEQQLPSLAANRVALYLAVSETTADWDGLAALLNQAAAQGVEVRPWLLLDVSHGYWFNKWNVNESQSYVFKFLDEMQKRGIHPSWLIFDVEPPADLIATMQKSFDKGDILAVRSQLETTSKSASILDAERAYNTLIDQLHERGIKVQAVAANFVLDDQRDGRQRIQSALGTPIETVAWDSLSFMIYRPELEKIMGPISEDIVFHYAKRAHDLYGDQTAIALGEIGPIHFPQPSVGYTDIADLQKDYSATLNGGINNIEFYSLDGIVKTHGKSDGIDFWIGSLRPEPRSTWDIKASFWLGLIDFARGFLPDGK